LGAGRLEDDKEKTQVGGGKLKEGEEPRLSEVRYRSEEVPHVGAYLLGVVRNGEWLVYFRPGEIHNTYTFRHVTFTSHR
jgi:hypothetical protein